MLPDLSLWTSLLAKCGVFGELWSISRKLCYKNLKGTELPAKSITSKPLSARPCASNPKSQTVNEAEADRGWESDSKAR